MKKATKSPATGAGDRHPRRRMKKGVVIAVAAALVAGFAVFGKEAIERQLIAEAPAANRALVDHAATTSLVGDISGAVERIFTYNAETLAETARNADNALTGEAKRQYTQLFSQVRTHATGKNVNVTTRVARAGAITMTGANEGDTAELLVFLDQVIDRGGKGDKPGKGEETGQSEDSSEAGGTPDPAAAQLVVSAVRIGGEWKISGITSTSAEGQR